MATPGDIEGQPIEVYIQRFDRELQAIQEHTATLADPAGLIPSTLVKMEAQMADTLKGMTAYKGAGASLPAGVTASQLGPGPSASTGGGTGSGGLTPDQQITQQLRSLNSDVSPKASVGGSGQLGWTNRVSTDEGFQLPRYGQLTVQDTLNYVAGLFADKANKVATTSQAYKDFTNMSDSDLYDVNGNFTDPGKKAVNAAMGAGGWKGAASNAFGTVAGGYTQGKAISALVQQVATPLLAKQNLAYLSGYQGGPGVMGIHPGAVWSGVGQQASEIGFGTSNNVSPDQARSIYNNLFGLGWFGGQSTNAMRQGLAQIAQTNPVLGTDPQVASMMDQATRLGAGSVSQFVDTMKQVPGAADAAHLSLAQVTSDVAAMGDYYKSIGGSSIAGQQAAVQWTNATGTTSQVMQTLLQNPMVQGQVFMQSGLIPWEQGNASTSQQVGGIFSALDMMSKAAGNLPPLHSKDAIGLTTTVSSSDRAASLLSNYFGVSQSQIKNLLQHQQGIQAGIGLQGDATTYLQQVQQGTLKNPNGSAWQALLQEAGQARDWNGKPIFTAAQLKKLATTGGTPGASNKTQINWMNKHESGGTMYAPGRHGDKDLERHLNWQQQQEINANPNASQWQKWNYVNNGSKLPNYLSPSQLAKQAQKSGQLPGSMQGTSAATSRWNQIWKGLQKSTQSANQGPQIQISLTGAAAKVFKLNSNAGQGKAQANAGGTSVNVPYGSGPTDDPLYANPNTSGSSSNSSSWGSTANNGAAPGWDSG